MKSLARFKALFKVIGITGVALTLVCIAGQQFANAQNLTINFRFDGQSGAAATTQTITAGAAGQSFTVDVWATITGPAGTTGNQAGLVTLRFRGLSSTANNSAFATGAGIGATAFTMLSPFQSTANIPTIGDVGSASAYATTSATLDGISDFGGTAATSAAVANSNSGTTPELGGTASATSEAVPNGWEFMIGRFAFQTGTAASTAGATTSFLPATGLGASSSKSSFTADGGTTFTHGDWTSGSAINFVVGGVVTGNDSTLAMAPATATINSLTAGINTTNLTVTNTAADKATATGAFTGAFSGTSAGASQVITGSPVGAVPGNVAVTYAALSTIGPVSFSDTITNTSNAGDSQAAGNKVTAFTVNVGNATADGTGAGPASANAFTNATMMTGVVAHGGSYAGLGSQVISLSGAGGVDAGNGALGSANASLGRSAIILAGTNNLANAAGATTVAMQWRTLSTAAAFNEQSGTTPAGKIYATNLLKPTTGLISDVVNLTGLTVGTEAAGGATDPFVLQMSYNPALLPKGSTTNGHTTFSTLEPALAANNLIYLVSYNAATGLWDRATDDDFANVVPQFPTADPRFGFQGSYAAFLAANPTSTPANSIGAWGVDATNHVVWADMDHNSQFAVVPEPSTILLAGLGLLGLVGLRRRMKSA